ncbi:DEAD/DEAH box helicase [Opitutus sp. ER46]|uniref:DEAD/DEAH box helicase n=1 Tax=Opitutus sp. ER46 TaxID=2161864 RepID=UPI000D325129|nr:DEAD/DEAH box helicase [Opitutus sp. ER46]PTX91771.1 hypothetical protein DB354_18095 [Opitutus sp. ER46]
MSGRVLSQSPLRVSLSGWLDNFPIATRAKGRAYYASGRVSPLEVSTENDETYVEASVSGSEPYDCTLAHAPGRGWDGKCSCPIGIACKHLYAVGALLLDELLDADVSKFSSPANAAGPTDEQALAAQFTRANGIAPVRKQLNYLRHLLALHRSVHAGNIDFQALQNLVPTSYRYRCFRYYENPFTNRWAERPGTPLELWSHLALILTERGVPAPPFMERLTDLAWARAAVAGHLRQREIDSWRQRFAQLEALAGASGAATNDAPPVLRHLRLRLAQKKPVWEISTNAAIDSPYNPLAGAELRELLENAENAPLASVSVSFAAMARAHFGARGRTTLRPGAAEDRAFLGRVLQHPLARECVVGGQGLPIVRDPRRLIWHFRDHPTDPDLVQAQLAFADGTPVPSPLQHLSENPALYLHENTLFSGLPPPTTKYAPSEDDLTVPVALPRAALALPEAGRFAARAGLVLPGDTAGRFRHEVLRPRLRAWLAPRRPNAPAGDDVLLLELAALAPDGAVRALLEGAGWRRTGPGLSPLPPDAAFIVSDFDPTRAAVEVFGRLPRLVDTWHPEGPRSHVEIASATFPETFSAWLATFPPATLIDLAPELAAFAQAPTRAHYAIDLTPSAAWGVDWFDVRVALRAEDTTLTPEEVALLHAARGRFVRLAGRGWRRLAVEETPAAQEKLEHLGLDPVTATAETRREPLRFHALQLADDALRDALPAQIWEQVRARAATLRALPPPPVPGGLVAELRGYQQEGFHFLSFLSENGFGGVLADDMGLGKTLQTLAWLLALAARSRGAQPFRALVVCPKSVMVNWQLETARFAPGLTTVVFHSGLVTPPPKRGAGSGDSARLAPFDAHILVVNYAQLRLHAPAFTAKSWDAVILDEGQNIKNPASATAQAARELRTAHRLVLTGTPIENRLLDLWSLLAFAQPGLLGPQAAFKRLYNDKNDPSARTRLAQRVKHFLLRRTKAQVARDLPPRIEEDLVVELEGTQRALYDAELKRARALLLRVKSARELDRQRFNILQSLLRLRQICCDPRLVGVGEAPRPARRRATATAPAADPASAKLEALLDTVEPLAAEGHKVLIFSQFVTMLELIRDELTARGIAHLMLTGQTEKRQELVDRFQNGAAIPVFLLSLKAAGAGLNLTAASYVVLFDPWWNPAVEAQAIDRTHRIGQRNQVIAYRLLARDTIEEKIRALQKEKAALAAAVVQEESLASVLDLESLRQILS